MRKNSWRNRRRTLPTVLSIGVFLCQLGVLMAMYRAFYLTAPAPYLTRRLVTRNRVALTFPLPLYYRDRIRQVSGVEDVMASQWLGGVYKDARDPRNFFPRFAIEPEKIFTIRGEMRLPDDEKPASSASGTPASSAAPWPPDSIPRPATDLDRRRHLPGDA